MMISSRPDYKTIKNNQSVSKVEGVSKLNKPIILFFQNISSLKHILKINKKEKTNETIVLFEF